MLSATAQKRASHKGNGAKPGVSTKDVEAEVIGLFVQISKIIGQPRSYAEIYGTLFLSPHPLTMDQVIERLGISRGSACQGLNFLRKAGAIKMIVIPPGRPRGGRPQAYYEAVAELRHLVKDFLRDQILPQVEDTRRRLNEIARTAQRLPKEQRGYTQYRVGLLQSWEKRVDSFVPLVIRMLED